MSDRNQKLPVGADLFGELQLSESNLPKRWIDYIPGLVFVGTAALAALWLSEHYGPPAILMGLLLGLALNFVSKDKRLAAGLDFSSQTLLRIGIVFIGVRITVTDIVQLGFEPFLSIICIMIAVIASGLIAAKLLRQNIFFGLLAGGATAICGASAALALWSIIGKERISQSQFTIVLLGITMASALAMTFYPMIAGALDLSDAQAGFLIGASIHDVAQAIGGGFAYSDKAGEVATVVKLSRVTLLAPVLIIVALFLNKKPKTGNNSKTNKLGIRQGLPWFIVGFIILVGLNSVLDIPPQIKSFGNETASILLLFAVIAAAIKSDTAGLLSHGWRSFGPIILTTLTAFGLSLFAAGFF